MSESCVLPEFETGEAAAAAARLFGLSGPIERLDGERDLNFLIGEPGARFVFKIANLEEDAGMLECQHLVFERIAAKRVFPETALARGSNSGKTIETLQSKAGARHYCRALPFIEGRMLGDVDDPGSGLLDDIGRRLARLDLALESFSHPALERPLLWKMDHALDVIDSFKPLLKEPWQQSLVGFFENRYRQQVIPRLPELRRGVIHNDANRGNIIVDRDGARVLSIIDFGDMVTSWLVVDPVLAATYVMLDRPDPLPLAAAVLRGFDAELPLQAAELDLAFDFICMRLCMSVCINAHQVALEPDNEYLSVDVASAWELMQKFRDVDPADAREILAP